MELIRQKNVATRIVFPLLSAGSTNYFTSAVAFSSMANNSSIIYTWRDSENPVSATLTNIPVQVSNTGLWYLNLTQGEMNPDSGGDDYVVLKFDATPIEEQTILIHLTNYAFDSLANSSNIVSAIATSVTDKTGYTVTAGTVNSLTNAVSVSSYSNFPSVNVSSVTNGVITSADFATDYYNKISSSLFVTNVVSANVVQWLGVLPNALQSGRVDSYVGAKGVLNDIDGSSVTATSVTDKTGYTVTAGTVNSLTNAISVSSYSNFPSVNVSSVTNGIITSADFATDYYDKIGLEVSENSDEGIVSANVVQWLGVLPNALQSGRVDSYVGNKGVLNDIDGSSVTATSITDKTGYTVTAGTVNSLTNAVSVSSYSNFPIVSVSSTTTPLSANVVQWNGTTPNALQSGRVDSYVGAKGVLNDIDGSSVTATSITDKTGYTVTAGTVNSLTNAVSVSSYSNFPSVNVSSVTDGAITSADYSSNYYDKIDEVLTSSHGIGSWQSSSGASEINANIIKVNGVSVTSVNDFQNTDLEIYNMAISALNVYDPPTRTEATSDKNEIIVQVNANELILNEISADTNDITVSGVKLNSIGISNVETAITNSEPLSANIIQVNGSNVVLDDFQNTQSEISAGTLLALNYYDPSTGSELSYVSATIVNEINSNETKIDNIQTTSNSISAVTNLFSFSGSNVNVNVASKGILNDINGSSVTAVSIPSVNVSSVTNGSITSADYSLDYFNKVGEIVSQNSVQGIVSANIVQWRGTQPNTLISGRVDSYVGNKGVLNDIDGSSVTAVSIPSVNVSSVTNGVITSADYTSDYFNKIGELVCQNSVQGVVSANVIQVNGSSITISDFKNTDQEMYDMASSALNVYDPPTYSELIDSLSSVNVSTSSVSAACVLAIEDKFLFDGKLVWTTVSGTVSADASQIAQGILSETIDTKTFGEILEILLAMATGRITRANNVFTYYKQNNSTTAFTLQSERSERTRL